MVRTRSRRYRKGAELVDRTRVYEANEALEILKKFPGPKFEEAVEIAVRLGIDPKKTDQLVRGSVSLPKGTGKEVRIAVFAEGDKAEAAKAAGADFVGGQDLAEKIEGGFTDFDMTIASPDMMRFVGKLGKVLGPPGKMPSPKAGTVTPNVGDAVREFKAGKIEFRNDDGGNLAAPMGRRSFSSDKLRENIEAFLTYVETLKPLAAKGTFVTKGAISSTHSPGILLKV